MREILFRGKNYDGEWIEGFFVHQGRCYEIYHKDYEEFPSRFIEPKTVGQYTGLTDRNGKRIFEGDIVRYNDTKHKVIFCTINGSAFFGITMPERGEIWNFDGITCANKMEVIGNIHDNPELLEGKS